MLQKLFVRSAICCLVLGVLAIRTLPASAQDPQQTVVESTPAPWMTFIGDQVRLAVSDPSAAFNGQTDFVVEVVTSQNVSWYLTTNWSDDGSLLLADFDESLVELDGSIVFRLWADSSGDGLEPGPFLAAFVEEELELGAFMAAVVVVGEDDPPASTAPAPFPVPGPPAPDVPTPPHPALPPYGQVPGKGGKPAPTLAAR